MAGLLEVTLGWGWTALARPLPLPHILRLMVPFALMAPPMMVSVLRLAGSLVLDMLWLRVEAALARPPPALPQFRLLA